MTAVEAYLEHKYGDENYIHYYGANDPEAYTYAHNIQNLNKALLMQNSFKSLEKRIKTNAEKFKENAADKEAAEKILSGQIFKNLGQIGYNNNIKINLPTPQTFEDCQAILQGVDTNLSSIEDFVDMLYKVLEKITGMKPQLLEHYAAQVVAEAASASGTMGKVVKNGGTIESAILTAVLSKHNQKFFQIQGQNIGVHTDIAKMLGLIYSLPEPNISDGSYAIMTGTSTNQVGTATNSQEIQTALKEKIAKWLVEIEKSTAETAIVMAVLKEKGEVFGGLGEVKKIIEKTGNQNVETKFIPDPQQERWIKIAGTKLAERTKKVYKSDVSIFADETHAEGQVGITVKDYDNVKITGEEGVHTVSGSLDIQKGTPLLTLLMREANISSNRLHQIVQFASGHEYTEGASNWDTDWEKMIQNLTYRMLVDALVGLRDTQDTAHFIAINGWIYNIVDFVNSFIHSQSSAKMSEYLGKYGNKDSTGGLKRQTYVDLNVWQGKTQRDQYQAEKRSEKTEKSVIKLMGDTKITISLNLLNMQNLSALNV